MSRHSERARLTEAEIMDDGFVGVAVFVALLFVALMLAEAFGG